MRKLTFHTDKKHGDGKYTGKVNKDDGERTMMINLDDDPIEMGKFSDENIKNRVTFYKVEADLLR